MKKALVQNTIIARIVDPNEIFTIGNDYIWVDVPDGTTLKDSYVDGAVVTYAHHTRDAIAAAFTALRTTRDIKLAESDWRAMPDSPTMSDAWIAYREALRDLPGTLNDTTVLETITWPTEPS
jgi:hypothetical protein